MVNIDATSRVGEGRRRRPRMPLPEPPDLFNEPFDFGTPRYDRDPMRRGAGSGFIIDADGSILTNNHVIEHAERITVKLSDGRSLRARLVGADPDTDIALIKVDGQVGLPVAPLGDSSTLRMGEWVCAIGNPLGYDHSVTVGVVSYLGRKLFDQALDNYIQTDAAINFGNSGGPLINARGEVIGINAAISSRASSIGFAVPINGARGILPQLRARGSVSRGFMGVTPRDVDADLQRSLKLGVARGALVQDVTDGSPADRAGLRVYDVIVGLDDQAISTDDQLIREIAARAPGTAARVRFIRGGRDQIGHAEAGNPAGPRGGRRRRPVAGAARTARRSGVAARVERPRSGSPDGQPAAARPRDERRADLPGRADELVVRRRPRTRQPAARDQSRARRERRRLQADRRRPQARRRRGRCSSTRPHSISTS